VKNRVDIDKVWSVTLLMLAAYIFGFLMRMIWVYQFKDNPGFIWNGEIMINTNDGYAFANAAREIISGISPVDGVKQAVHHYSPGLIYLTVYLTKLTPFSLETVILYLPAIVSSLIVVPIILTGRLMRHTFLGFLSALLGVIAWSYYNRTMTGYYDTDMFSVLLQFSILYALLRVAYRKDLSSVALAALLMFAYPYFYSQGMVIVYAVFVLLVIYLLLEYYKIMPSDETRDFAPNAVALYASIVLLSAPLMLVLPMGTRVILFALTIILLRVIQDNKKYMQYLAIIYFIGFLYFSHLFHVVFSQLSGYLFRGVEEDGLHFYQVVQTVREAGAIPFSTMANRISGSSVGVVLSLAGYIILVARHRPFIIALPLIGVGVLSLWAGLRFTVYAVPVAAISVVYLFWVIGGYFKDRKATYLFVTLATAAMIYPNITHILGYKVPTVLNKAEVEDLTRLGRMAAPKDYTLGWWDYGYPIWFYSDTNTIIDGGKHNNDNFIISKIMQTDSPALAARLGRLAVETYVDTNYSNIANTLFQNGEKDQKDPNLFLAKIEGNTVAIPPKSREIYLYLPYRMMGIFPTVMVFGNIDLTTGKRVRDAMFYPAYIKSSTGGMIILSNGIMFDSKKGELHVGKRKLPVKEFIVTQNQKDNTISLQSHIYHRDGKYAVVYMKSYGRFVVMDEKTFHSIYVQMFMLGKHDKKFFELVVSSPYSKIYRIKQ